MALRAGITRALVRQFTRVPKPTLWRPLRGFSTAAYVEEHRIQEALKENQRLHPEDFMLIANSHGELAKFYLDQNKSDLVLEHTKKQYEQLLKLDPQPHADLMRVGRLLLDLLYNEYKFQECEVVTQQYLTNAQSSLPSNSLDVARAHFTLGHLQEILGKYAETTQNCMIAAEIVRKYTEPELLASIYEVLANVKKHQMQLAEAETYIMTAQALLEESKSPEKENLLAGTYTIKGEILACQGKFQEAEELQIKALNTRRNAAKPNPSEISTCLNNLGMLFLQVGRIADAERLLKEKLELDLKEFTEMHPSTANSYHNLSAVDEARGDFQSAKIKLLKALEIRNKTLNSLHPYIAAIHQNLFYICLSLKQLEEADQHATLAADMGSKIYVETHPFMGTVFYDLGVIQEMKEKPQEALQYFNKSLEIRLKNYPEAHKLVGSSCISIGQIYKKLNNPDKALEFTFKGYNVMKQLLPEDDPSITIIINNIGSIYYCQGKFAEAEEYVKKSFEIRVRKLSETHPEMIGFFSNLSAIHLSMGKFAEAETELKKAIQLLEVNTHPQIEISTLAQMLYTALYQQNKTKEAAAVAKKYGLKTSS